jgi:hypothetical protein
VDQEAVGAIADAIISLARDRALLARISVAARKRAERDFDAMALARNFVAAIRSTSTPQVAEPVMRAVTP